MMMSVVTHRPWQTIELGKRLGHLLEKGDVVALVGELGAGKTTLTTGIAAGLEVEDYVRSPTFTLINEYQGRIPLYHFDLYRLSCLTDLEELGYQEYFYGEGATIIEWAQKCKELLPQNHLRIEIEVVDKESRQINIFLPEDRNRWAFAHPTG
ncbi:tRNA (adenosine(37)-N6)-threonylcarbamoyltransferase complex ATPase subunit type 1 TsaE [bacterium]|nr:tRNA (adenosine(37)-N6)-threonylcarbamoyltransferase complex ATPase subunit type 1 TsaE [bacterium]